MPLFKRWALLLLLASFAGTTTAQENAMPVQMDFDYATFAFAPDSTLLELYMSFEAVTLTYEHNAEGYRAHLPLNIAVLRNTDVALPGTPLDPVWADSTNLTFALTDTSGLVSGHHFLHQVRTTVPAGEYLLQVTIPRDSTLGRSELMLRHEIIITSYDTPELLRLSDVTLATSIERGDIGSPFYKNGLHIRPNANQIYGNGLDRLYYYAEAYNADQALSDQTEYTVFSYIAEANRPQPLSGLQRRATREVRSPDVLVGMFDVSELPSGPYFLRIAVLNEQNESLTERSRKFFVYNPHIQRETVADIGVEVSFENSPYATMPEAEVDQAYEHIRLIATDQERDRMKRIKDLDERRRFLMDFWERRDPNPNTAVNEFQEEFYSRLQYANDRYTGGGREGWETDRGRVLIKYGVPSAIDPHLYDRDKAPHEIWEYNNITGEGQAIFIFADRSGFGEFELLHSTVTGERQMVNWEQELSKR